MSASRGSWVTSPASLRIQAWLQANRRGGTVAEIAAATHTCHVNAALWIRQMHAAGVIRVGAWRQQHGNGGPMAKVWAWGSGVDAPKPAPASKAEIGRRRREKLAKLFGKDIARTILSAEVMKRSVVVVDGVPVYRRGVGVDLSAAKRLAA